MPKTFPRTTVGGISLPRMLIGTNWVAGFSHTSAAADNMITKQHNTPEAVAEVFEPFLQHNINAVMGFFSEESPVYAAVQLAQQRSGKEMIIIDTPEINVDDSPAARAEAEASIKRSAKMGARFCLIHHSSCEELVNKNRREITRLPDYLAMIRDAGMIPGLSAHMPEIVQYADANEYDVETYIQIYNPIGFLMQVEVDIVNRVIWNAKKPVMTIKSMAAGRTTPFVGLNFAWGTLRESDMVTVGCFSRQEAEEDIEISMAHFEKRMPLVCGRNSPVATTLVKNPNM